MSGGMGPVRRTVPSCPSISSGCRPSTSAPSRTRATPSPPPSRPRPSRSSWTAATSWPAPRPGPARRRPSCCRCSSASVSPTAPIRALARRPIRALILAPTRELALQVEESVRVYGRHSGRPLHGHLRRRRLQRPGHRASPRAGCRRRHARPPARPRRASGPSTCRRSRSSSSTRPTACSTWASSVTSGASSRSCRARRQNLLFSATFSDEIRGLASGFLHEPASVQVTPRNSAAPLVTQVVHPVDRERKRELLAHLIRTGVIDQALVFTRTKHGANRLAEQLAREGISAIAIHGNKSQGQRVRALADFKSGRTPILVATEIAARGLDIDGLPHVVNFELPMVPEDYVHRIGRTGRAGETGHAVSLVCVDEERLLRDIERVLGAPIPVEVVAGLRARSLHPPRTDPAWRSRAGSPDRPAPRRIASRRPPPARQRPAPEPCAALRRPRPPGRRSAGPSSWPRPRSGPSSGSGRARSAPGPGRSRPAAGWAAPAAQRPAPAWPAAAWWSARPPSGPAVRPAIGRSSPGRRRRPRPAGDARRASGPLRRARLIVSPRVASAAAVPTRAPASTRPGRGPASSAQTLRD